jgi:hypothetical protein
MSKKLKKKLSKRAENKKNMDIVIDEKQGLVFKNENELYQYFRKQIDFLEDEFQSARKQGGKDFTEKDLTALMPYLDLTLDQPDKVWMDEATFKEFPIYHFHRACEWQGEPCHYIASAYVEEDSPTFIFLHFATKLDSVDQVFQRGQLIYDRLFEAYEPAYLEGDALVEGDSLAFGLFSAMMKIRSEKDIPVDKFKDYGKYREDAIENPDEIWKSQNLQGQNLVTFIKDISDHEGLKEMFYLVITQEEAGNSHVHTLLFSFPTNDLSLVERYKQGENLQAEEVTQENSH